MAERQSKTLFVRNLPFTASNETLTKVFGDIGPVKTAFVVKEKGSDKCKGYGYVKFSMLEDAVKAKEEVKQFEGRNIFSSFANAKQTEKKKKEHGNKVGTTKAEDDSTVSSEVSATKDATTAQQKPVVATSSMDARTKTAYAQAKTVAVRGLPPGTTPEKLQTLIKDVKCIAQVDFPVQGEVNAAHLRFKCVRDAKRAVRRLQVLKLQAAQLSKAVPAGKEKGSQPITLTGKRQGKDKRGRLIIRNLSFKFSTLEAAGRALKEMNSKQILGRPVAVDWAVAKTKYVAGTQTASSTGTKPEKKSDVGEGRTVFIRNVPFEAEEDELSEVFEEFGELVYARLVLDAQTERPKGTAFVQFKTKEAAEQCFEKGQETGQNAGIGLHGRRLIVVPALSRTEAQNRAKVDKTKEKKDSRNLFLAREGMIRPGTQAAAGISQEDMAKRMKIEQMKRERLKNQNIFVSSTRLCVHNLPTKTDEKELWQIALNAAEDPEAKITECRVMRDMQRVNNSGVAKSLGYAFVNFTKHEHALKALRGLNNSEVFGVKKRPIVEFSLENRRALEVQEKRREKSKVAQKRERKQAKAVNPQKQQDKIARAQHTGPKGLPKHFGPKIRHRDRNKGRQIVVLVSVVKPVEAALEQSSTRYANVGGC
ncbi:hypothetical protein BaRGS_00032570, partial [Batillaria attramentaria]